METEFNDMQKVKRSLFAMRNGVIADTLRKAGSPFSVIFGVNLPQLVDIANETGKNRDLALRLWANNTTRESMLLAPMLMPDDDFSLELAQEWTADVKAVEVADVLCHRLLRNRPYALQLAQTLARSEDFLTRYTGLRLMCHIGDKYPNEALLVGRAEAKRDDRRTLLLALQLQDYAQEY